MEFKKSVYATEKTRFVLEDYQTKPKTTIKEQDRYISGLKLPKIKGVLYDLKDNFNRERGRDFTNSMLGPSAETVIIPQLKPKNDSKYGVYSEKVFVPVPPRNIKPNRLTAVRRNVFPRNPNPRTKQQQAGFDAFAFGEQTDSRQTVENQVNAVPPKPHHSETDSESKIKQGAEQKLCPEYEKLIKQLQQEVKLLRMENVERGKTIIHLQDEVEKSNSKLKSMVSDNLKKQEKLDQFQENLKTAIRSLKDQDAKHKTQNETLKKEAFDIRTKLRKTEERQAKAELASQSLEQKLHKEKESLGTFVEKHAKDAANHRQELQSALQNLRDQNAKHKDDKKPLLGEIRELKAKLSKSEELRAKTELGVQSLREELQKNKEYLLKLTTQCSRDSGDLKKELQTALQNLGEQDAKHKEKKKVLQSEVQELKAKVAKSEELKASAELSARCLKKELQRTRESFAEVMQKKKTKMENKKNAQQKSKEGKTSAVEKKEKAGEAQRAEEVEKENSPVQDRMKAVENTAGNQPLPMEEKGKPTVAKSLKKKKKRVL